MPRIVELTIWVFLTATGLAGMAFGILEFLKHFFPHTFG